MIVGIHQPNYIPWIGYFYKICKSDIFIFLDDVQFEKNGYADRNSIKTPQGKCYLKVPVKTNGLHTTYQEVILNDSLKWRDKHLKTIEMNYKKAKYYEEIMEFLRDRYISNAVTLSNFNIEFISEVVKKLDFNTILVRSSDLNIQGVSTERLKNLILKVKGNCHLSGKGGEKYQEETVFQKNGIELIYTDFKHPYYSQLWGEFCPNLSIVDLLFNYGFCGARDIICRSGVEINE